jgi:cell division protein FtsB
VSDEDEPQLEGENAAADAAEAESKARRDRSPMLLLLAVLAVLLAVGTAAIQGWRDLADQRAHEQALVRSIAQTQGDLRALQERIERLQKDPVTLERLARQELGLVRPEDLVLVFPEPPAPPPAAQRAPLAAPRATRPH